jgi:antitoxin (DNA-binding transcriptional repressor) of toxin-antitoxin stability system
MSTHTIAELQADPHALIDRAQKGEAVEITDGEKVVATLNAVSIAPKAVSGEIWDWLAERRATRPTMTEDAGTFISRMRDEEWTR